jgi:hypothetical protein
MSTKPKKTTARKARSGISAARLAEMIEEATVDAYDESEQATGWFTMFEEHLELPFETVVLGVLVTVEAIDQRDDNRIVAVCARGKEKLAAWFRCLSKSAEASEVADAVVATLDAFEEFSRDTYFAAAREIATAEQRKALDAPVAGTPARRR